MEIPMTDDDTVVVCVPTSWSKRPRIAGSVQRYCNDCGAPVWLAPSSEAVLGSELPFALIVCVTCVARSLGEPDLEHWRHLVAAEEETDG
jgi:hypothetical protein